MSWMAPSPFAWRLNLGDALSPVIVAMMAGMPVEHVPFRSRRPRLGAVGTVGHLFHGGAVAFWGTGASPHLDPFATEKRPYVRPPDTRVALAAMRGPFSRAVLGEGAVPADAVFGDPLWLLPRFHPAPPKRWDLGVVVHLSELVSTAVDAGPRPDFLRYAVPASLGDRVRVITTTTEVSVAALRARLDEILACRRIVSTSLHGLVFAESYGIPCLYFSTRTKRPGPARAPLLEDGSVDLRFVDLYRGLGRDEIELYGQPRDEATDWDAVIDAVDATWTEKPFDAEPLARAFPVPGRALTPEPGFSAFDHPLVAGVPLREPASPVHLAARLRRDLAGLAARLGPVRGRRAR
ncbi:exopolysaccharide glucosyl ketal-pyruvate-transferase [Oharaeibacter diazotrophicus]|nr:exopolysaccharide glucosyl ketal-pyruvate-transferase [Oharaeibacter diazotrophicus]